MFFETLLNLRLFFSVMFATLLIIFTLESCLLTIPSHLYVILKGFVLEQISINTFKIAFFSSFLLLSIDMMKPFRTRNYKLHFKGLLSWSINSMMGIMSAVVGGMLGSIASALYSDKGGDASNMILILVFISFFFFYIIKIIYFSVTERERLSKVMFGKNYRSEFRLLGFVWFLSSCLGIYMEVYGISSPLKALTCAVTL